MTTKEVESIRKKASISLSKRIEFSLFTFISLLLYIFLRVSALSNNTGNSLFVYYFTMNNFS